MEENMRTEAGARSDTPFFLVLLTDGKSQDDAIAAANRLKSAGVEIIAVGETDRRLFCSYCSLLRGISLNPEQPVRTTPLFISCSGVKNADEAELRQVASEPVDLNVYNVNDFPLLSKLVARLVHILCGRIEDRGVTKRNLSIHPIQNILLCFAILESNFSNDQNLVDALLLWIQGWSRGPQQTQPSPTRVLPTSGSLTWAPGR